MPAPLAAFGAVVVFGGGMNVRDAEPAAVAERRDRAAARRAAAAASPSLGRLPRRAAARRRRPARRCTAPPRPRSAGSRSSRTAPDPVLDAMPQRFYAYEWHSYTFELPAGAVELARSAICSQAYRLGEHAWGVQFHPEVTPEIVRFWAYDFESDPDAIALGFDPEAHIGWPRSGCPSGWRPAAACSTRSWLQRQLLLSRLRPGRPAAARSAPAPPPRRG